MAEIEGEIDGKRGKLELSMKHGQIFERMAISKCACEPSFECFTLSWLWLLPKRTP
jgi:hypothetical protein